uniref:Uncharacterized protein n=1 Tax=Cannabis sativa TaxID=3483 RepID=A0A803QN79_CANSA
MYRRLLTTKSDSRGGNNASLDNSIFLASEGLFQETEFLKESGVGLNDDETQQSGGDVERGNDSGGEVEFTDDKVKEDAEYEGCGHSSVRDLVVP